MKATKIYYEKCFNLGNYENEKIGVEIQLEENETVECALDKAKETIEKDKANRIEKQDYEKACKYLRETNIYNNSEINKAKDIILKYQAKQNDLPF